MRPFYALLATLALGALGWPQQAAAQEFTDCPADQDECVVEWQNPSTGEPIINALRNTVANDDDRTEGRVYKLLRGGYYYNEEHITNTGFHLRIVGQTAAEGAATGQNVCGTGGTEDCGPAIIQRYAREDGTVDGLMLESSGDGTGGFTLQNLWIMGQDNTGVTNAYEPITINSSNSEFLIDNVVFDRNEWHHLGFKQGGNDVTIRNSSFRNLAGTTQIWEGRVVRFEAGARSLVMENNSIFNVTSFPVQSEAAPLDYFLFNHNTLVNVGRNFNAGALWKEAYIANNLMINPFWQGESEAQFQERLATWTGEGNAPEDIDPYIGFFSIAALPSQYGLEADRRILLANNNFWRSPDIENAYGPLGIRAQPLVSDSTQAFFDAYERMTIENNYTENPMLVSAPTTADVYAQMETFLGQWVNGDPTPWEYIYWDLGRPDPGTELHPISINWPLPEDFSYTNAALLDGGTDGLPVGDLNWFPQEKEDYLANREAYVAELESMAGPEVVPPTAILTLQAEAADVIENAEVQSVEGFTSFFMEGSGSITWTFDVPADGTYGLNVMTNLRGETTRGQHVRVDGVGLQNSSNYGEYFFCSVNATDPECDVKLEQNTWSTVEIRQADLIAEKSTALTLTAGTHTLQIAPSWGYQAFSTVEVVDASGAVVAELTPPEATAVGLQEICDEDGFCASGFQWVDLGAGGSVTWNVAVPDGTAGGLLRLFYQSEAGASATLLVDGTEVETVSFPAATGDAASEVASAQFALTPGARTITIESATGGMSLDNAFLLLYNVGPTAAEELPEGWALGNSFPNPTAGAATIRFSLGEAADVRLAVYDVLGRQVATLADGLMAAGPHEVRLNTGALASGTYVYRLTTPVGAQTRRMTVIR